MREAPPSSLPSAFPPRDMWILGAGRFGYIAAERLSRRYPDASYLVIDLRDEKLDRIRLDLGLPVHREDAIAFLTRTELPDRTWIIPAVPIHIAYEWLRAELARSSVRVTRLPVPEEVDPQAPNPYRTLSGTVYTSFATFMCPDACNEPDDICTFTKAARPGNLFEELGRIQAPGFHTEVVRSWQLAPGVGGYAGDTLKSRLHAIATRPGAYLIATSCRCHGVIDAFEWSSDGKA